MNSSGTTKIVVVDGVEYEVQLTTSTNPKHPIVPPWPSLTKPPAQQQSYTDIKATKFTSSAFNAYKYLEDNQHAFKTIYASVVFSLPQTTTNTHTNTKTNTSLELRGIKSVLLNCLEKMCLLQDVISDVKTKESNEYLLVLQNICSLRSEKAASMKSVFDFIRTFVLNNDLRNQVDSKDLHDVLYFNDVAAYISKGYELAGLNGDFIQYYTTRFLKKGGSVSLLLTLASCFHKS